MELIPFGPFAARRPPKQGAAHHARHNHHGGVGLRGTAGCGGGASGGSATAQHGDLAAADGRKGVTLPVYLFRPSREGSRGRCDVCAGSGREVGVERRCWHWDVS